jgi:hypothetical protein
LGDEACGPHQQLQTRRNQKNLFRF